MPHRPCKFIHRLVINSPPCTQRRKPNHATLTRKNALSLQERRTLFPRLKKSLLIPIFRDRTTRPPPPTTPQISSHPPLPSSQTTPPHPNLPTLTPPQPPKNPPPISPTPASPSNPHHPKSPPHPQPPPSAPQIPEQKPAISVS